MLKIYHLRNATMLIETKTDVILVDPMLNDQGSMPSFTQVRFKPHKNPLVCLPDNSKKLLDKVTHCIITHKHEDHLDEKGEAFLKENKILVSCSIKDKDRFLEKGLNIINLVNYWTKINFLNGSIEGVPAKHGYGKVADLMGDVMGFFLSLPGEKSIYLSSDTVYTNAVDKVLKNYTPDISVLACGSAQLDDYKPILMDMNDIIKFIENAPGKVLANHLEALNHCPTTRNELRKALVNHGLKDKVWIPEDGEGLEF